MLSTFNKEKALVVGAFSRQCVNFVKVYRQLYQGWGGPSWLVGWKNNYDDSGINAIRLRCSGGEELISAEGVEGDWTPWTFTKSNTPLVSVFTRSQRPESESSDDTALHGLRFVDSDGTTYYPHEGHNNPGYWTRRKVQHCCSDSEYDWYAGGGLQWEWYIE